MCVGFGDSGFQHSHCYCKGQKSTKLYSQGSVLCVHTYQNLPMCKTHLMHVEVALSELLRAAATVEIFGTS